MLHKNAVKLTDFLFSHCPIDTGKRLVLIYGSELVLSTLISFFSIMVISVLLRDFLSALLFIAIFFFLRLFAGGFHASTYAYCFIITNTTYLVTYGSAWLLETYLLPYAILVIGVVAGVTIFFLTPIRNAKHPLSKKAYLRNKKISRLLIIFEVTVLCLSFITRQAIHYLSIFTTSLTAVAVMMIIPKLKEGRD